MGFKRRLDSFILLISHLDSFVPNGMGGHPKHIFMLTCDAFGVLPPISQLTPEQAMYHFVSGYTAKVAGTERGLGSEPEATFSPCFGAPFMVMHPGVYANLLRDRMNEHDVTCWLVNPTSMGYVALVPLLHTCWNVRPDTSTLLTARRDQKAIKRFLTNRC